MSSIDGGKTGWPSGLLQDDCKGLSRWLASRVDARWVLRRALQEQRKTAGEPKICRSDEKLQVMQEVQEQ